MPWRYGGRIILAVQQISAPVGRYLQCPTYRRGRLFAAPTTRQGNRWDRDPCG